ncbi:MAG: hypothetical protein HN737_12090 [Desulfobacterales bacterium]|jgi:hypothetical protein|nr:hypothetical protein [Desulfobacteraceae bacterium]MBT4365208.1 hypothetical protein [Desulfobacteraceae bacterium]MBT7085333.1 hypothetical protein [Desulfobacterales bacterium]MBT7698137.1 hypothetical protein [Desulfobacterales bacterium]
MEENKRKKIEDKLRAMLMHENQPQDEKHQTGNKFSGVKVIRRRKGSPDLQIV